MPVNTLYTDGDNSQLRQVIFDATPTAVAQTKEMAQQFKGKTELETCQNIFNFLKNKITYRADGYHQKVKLPSALLREKVGDCKSYSVFTYAILSNLGIGCRYVLTSYNSDPTPTHIYVETNSGIIIDAVWGKFNSEKKPTYKYRKDMRISTITGIKGNVQIGCSDCQPKRIGQTAEQWYDQNQGLVKSKDKATHLLAVVPASAMRVLILRFIENNSGGIATAVWNKIYRAEGTKVNIPQSEKNAIENEVKSNALKNGVKIPTEAQRNSINNLVALKVVGYEGSGINRKPILKASASIQDAWTRIMGFNQYDLYLKYYATPLKNQLDALEKRYTLGAVSQSDVNNYREFLKDWYQLGGNPNDIKEAVAKGKDKRPKGKTANYMLMVAKTRGLKFKDIGLILRGFADAFTGEDFEWGADKTYILGYNKGIGEPATATVIATWIGVISGLLTLLGKIFSFVDLRKEKSKAEEEMVKLETDGYVLEQDYYSLPIPRNKVLDIKQVLVPTAEAPSLEDIGSAVEFFATFVPTGTSRDANTPLTLEQMEAQKKEGALPPFMANEVENAKKDKYTLEALQKASSLTERLVPTANEKVVTYYKLSESKDQSKEAGFGGAILPVLIGVGVLMALNKSKKM